MKKLGVALFLLLWMGVWAQEGNVQELEFREFFSYVLRVAETPCPEQLRPIFPEATCYRHGYPGFFDFKEMLLSFVSGPDDYLEPWKVVTMNFEGETAEVFRARYRFRKNPSQLTLTYVSERLLVLETERATP